MPTNDVYIVECQTCGTKLDAYGGEQVAIDIAEEHTRANIKHTVRLIHALEVYANY